VFPGRRWHEVPRGIRDSGTARTRAQQREEKFRMPAS